MNDDEELAEQLKMEKTNPADANWVTDDLDEKVKQFPEPDYNAFSTSTPLSYSGAA